MSDDSKRNVNDNETNAASNAHNTQPGVLTAEQQDAVAALAATNVYVKQSKWKTFKELPKDKKWPFFVQHFLLGTVAVVVAIAVVISLVVTIVTRPPEPELTVIGFDMSRYDTQLDKLKAGFVKDRAIDDDRLIDMNGDYSISGDGFSDDSAKVMTMVTAGDINMMIASKDTFAQLNQRGLINTASTVEDSSVMDELANAGVLVDKNGELTDDAAQAYGFALSKSSTWSSIDGLPSDMMIGFSNVTDQTHQQRAKQFIAYLKFE